MVTKSITSNVFGSHSRSNMLAAAAPLVLSSQLARAGWLAGKLSGAGRVSCLLLTGNDGWRVISASNRRGWVERSVVNSTQGLGGHVRMLVPEQLQGVLARDHHHGGLS